MVRRQRTRGSRRASPPRKPSPPPADVEAGTPLFLQCVVLLALVGVPLTLRVEIEHGRRSVLAANVPIVDLVIWISVASILIFNLFRRKDRGAHKTRSTGTRGGGFRAVFVELWVFVAIGGLSTMATAFPREGVREFVQLVDYYIIGYWLVTRMTQFKGVARSVTGLVSVLVIGFVSIAAWQVWSETPNYLIRSLFQDHWSYLATFVLLAPLAWLRFVSLPGRLWQALGTLLLGIGCCCLGSLGIMLLVWFELGFASWLLGGRWIRRGAWVAGTSLVVLLLMTPSSYRAAFLREPATWFHTPLGTTRRQVLQAKRAMHPPPPFTHLGAGVWHCFVGSNVFNWMQTHSRPAIAVSSDVDPLVTPEYYAESLSALRLIACGPLLGHGLGNWQEQIGTRYDTLERTGTSAPNSSNGYLMIGVMTGVLGLLVWLIVLRRVLIQAYRRISSTRGSSIAHVAPACLAGLVGAAVFMMWCPLTTQPVAAYWVLLAAVVRGTGSGAYSK